MKKTLVALLLLASAGAFAQTSPAKQALIDKLLSLQRPAIEQTGQALAERPALQMMQQAGVALQTRVAPEKREAVAKDIQAELKKYADEVVPLMQQQAVKLAPATVGVMLAEKFTEDELKQLIAIIESPVNRKFLQMGGEMQKVLADKLVTDMQTAVDPKVKALAMAMDKHLGLPAASANAAKPAGAAPKK
ncbi:hypothetical protein [Rhodoferax sp.]|uniref:hypothetical protein n=1 Tax=Rhodoferax sp. TaxID=50421 RepID=UPI00273358E7|nr:hypothetical protein [Rhodoferax sp.]MDP3190638.1 hypothetical protein [Rhodoferax sp.]MDP3337963.1 hypothetical protein [Rhodoferax sp.]